ncbi:anillin, actin binding protein 2 isoform X5 [Nelusetta ayraudi]|uniref:anillin, actin binding protein 2 isoform X5 n=1 Tax=Nelusetta ayraudi TaxID=303726 RepID=UPI003F704CC3
MEAGEDNYSSANLKRQRAPLSDSEDNVFLPSEVRDGQKRRRLEAAGQENQSPKSSTSRRLVEQETKPDTPMVPSIRSRVVQLTQRQDGGPPLAQRCLSDPGADSPSNLHRKGFKEHLLSEGEFNQRLERFKVPDSQASPASALSQANHSPRPCSNFVSDIQQKLQCSTTPSSQQASRLREERKQELSRLQPISQNAWLIRSTSDPSLAQADGDAEFKDGSFTEMLTSASEKQSFNGTDAELSSHDETNTAEIIDQMFGEVLEYAGMMEQEKAGKGEDLDSGIGTCADDKATTGTESGKEKNEDEEEEDGDEEDGSGDELLTFPSSGILSPLSKSVEAVVTPLRLAVDQGSNPPPLLEETPNPPPEAAPLYSVDAYRTQRQVKKPAAQSITPVQKQVPLQPQPQPSVKAKITALNEEAGKLQTVINQTLQALSCCTDEEHGRGSLEEAEAEKLLLVSCEKRSALLAEVARLRAERSSESGEDGLHSSLQPCRGTVSISNIQLPLKVEFVCSSHNKSGRPSHYFFVLIRYGPCNIVATPLATAADAQNGDTISFPTAVTLKDIRSSFEIDVEVYSLSHTSSTNCNMDRPAAKSRVTPRKLLNTLTRSSNSLTAAAPLSLHARRSSNFSLVGSHKITLASLGHSKFPLDKMKLDGKIRRLLGDEFQEKVPFLSPLEGNIYLRLDSQSHTNIQHQGFLTMFELLSGYGVWHRRYFVLEGCTLYYWNHPNDREAKAAEGRISLSSSPHRHVRPVERDSCARPFTFELVNDIQQRKDGSSQDNANAKCWFSADTKQEKLDWIEKLSQALLDLHTWSQASRPARSQQSEPSSSENLRESIL